MAGSRPPEPLWREVLGAQLRAERRVRGERIVDVACRAGLAPQYLSELERGRKDPSSEVLSAVAGALGLAVAELTRRAARRLAAAAGLLPAARLARRDEVLEARGGAAAHPRASGPIGWAKVGNTSAAFAAM